MTYEEAWEYLNSKGIYTLVQFKKELSKEENQINIGMFVK